MQVPIFNKGSNGTADLVKNQQMLTVFGGYNAAPRIAEGEWADEHNMTSAYYPVLSTRPFRQTVGTYEAAAGMIAKDALAIVSGQNVVYSGYTIEMELSTAASMCPKQLLSFGAYLLIWPDKKYLNTQDFTDKGSMENTFTLGSGSTVSATLCRVDGTAYGDYTVSDTAPQDPSNGDMWMDTSNQDVPVLKEWSETSAMWVTIPTTYMKLETAGIGAGFEQFDGVELSGLSGQLEQYNGSHVLYGVDDNYIVVVGIMRSDALTQTGGLTVSRTVPDMDFVTECDNRVWGCKYGMVDGKPVNEIYASKLGDFKNWNCFMGLSTDSFAAGRGSDGVFTGAITHQGHPLFFRENCVEKVYPSSVGAHQIVTAECRGVQKGSWRSLAIVGETLFYKSRNDVCAYSGALPVSASEALGDAAYDDARAGAIGKLYYISMRRVADNTRHLFILDTEKGIWHREDTTRAMAFAQLDGALYYINESLNQDSNKLMCCSGGADQPIEWSVTSGVIGFDLAENEYISRFVIRCETQGSVHLEIQYDEDGVWIDKGTWTGRGLGSFVLPVAPRRCDHLRYRLSGDRAIKIFSITKYVQVGSDVHW
jgi:hypothetical protein